MCSAVAKKKKKKKLFEFELIQILVILYFL